MGAEYCGEKTLENFGDDLAHLFLVELLSICVTKYCKEDIWNPATFPHERRLLRNLADGGLLVLRAREYE